MNDYERVVIDPEVLMKLIEELAKTEDELILNCGRMVESMEIALQCMSENAGKRAALKVQRNVAELYRLMPVIDDTIDRLTKVLKLVLDLERREM